MNKVEFLSTQTAKFNNVHVHGGVFMLHFLLGFIHYGTDNSIRVTFLKTKVKIQNDIKRTKMRCFEIFVNV